MLAVRIVGFQRVEDITATGLLILLHITQHKLTVIIHTEGNGYKYDIPRKKLRLTSFVLTARSLHAEYSKSYRLLGTNDDPNANPSWTTLMASSLSWGSPGASLVLTPDGVLGYYNTYRLLITQCTVAYCSIARFIPSFVKEGNTISNVFSFNGTHVDTLIADVKANSDYTAVGHLPLAGGGITGDLTVDGEMNIGGAKIAIGATNGLQLYGPSSNIGGPHIQAFVSTDDYPVFQQLNNSHGSIAMCFDAYADGFTWKSSSSDSNAIIYKSTTDLEFSYSSGIAPGGEVTWNAGFSMDLANGLVSFSNGLDVTGDLTFGDITQFEMPILTSNTGNPDFIASASSEHSEPYQAWKAFNKSTSTLGTECWHIAPYDYTGTNNDYNGDFETMVDGDLMRGQWLQLETTSRYYITGFYLQSRGTTSTCSENFTVAVSDDGKNFTSIYSRVNQTWGANTARTYPNDATEITPTKGRYFRLITTRCYNSNILTIKEWRITFVQGGTVIDGTSINGVDIDTLITDVSSNTAKVSADGTINTHSDVNITSPTDGHLLTYTSGEWKNIPPPAVDGYLPLEGGTLTGDLNINGGLAIGDGKLKGGIRVSGPGRSNDGPHFIAYVSGDPYPVFEILNYAHNEATLAFDAYLEDGLWRSSSTASNCLFAKGITSIDMFFSHGIAKGGALYKQDLLKGFTMNTETGLVICHYGLEVKGDITVSGTAAMPGALNIDPSNHGEKVVFYKTDPTEVPYGIQTSNGFITHGVEYNGSHLFIYDIDGKLATAGYMLQLKRTGSIMNTELSMNNHKITDLTTPTDAADASTKEYVDTAVSAKLSVNGTSTMTGNLNMGNQDIDNVNQIFIDRKSAANNKLVLYDGGTPSTTSFYGFGIQSATLLYNVDGSSANHKFYYGGTNELFRIGNAGVYSYRNLDVKGNIILSGTVDGIDIQSLNTTVGGKLSLTGVL